MPTTENRVKVFPALALAVSALLLWGGCSPPGARALLDGQRLLRQGKSYAAIQKLEVAVQLLSTNAQAWNHLGLAYHAAGRAEDAARAYQRALQRDPNLAVVKYNLGCLDLENGNLPAAIDALTSYTLLEPRRTEAWLKLGTAQLRNRQLDSAERSFREALKLNPSLPEALNGLGIVLIQRRRYQEANQCFSGALQLQPQYGPALLNQAVLLQRYLNRKPQALERYRNYLAIRPQPPNAGMVREIARQLETELRPPPPKLVPTNETVLIAKTTSAPPPVVQPPQVVQPPATSPPPVTSAPPARVAAKPSPVPAKTVPPPVAAPIATAPAEPKTEVVKVAEEPPVKPPTEPPTDSPPAADAPSVTVSAPTNVVVSLAPPVPTMDESGNPRAVEKPGFFSRLNPGNWFRSKPKKTTPLPPLAYNSGVTVPATAVKTAAMPEPRAKTRSVGEPATKADVKAEAKPGGGEMARTGAATPLPRVSYSRYRYLRPAKPAPGDRAEGQRAFNEAMQAQERNQLAAAVTAYRRAVQSDPSSFEGQYNLGLAAYLAGDLDQSLAAYEHALAITPNSLNALYNFALALQRAGYPQDAANELQKLLAEYPSETRAHFTLAGVCANQLFRRDLARPHYQKVLELEPQHPQATQMRFWLAENPP